MEKMRVGISSCGFKELTEENFRDLREAGIKDLEISAGEMDYADNLDWESIKQNSKKYGVNLWSFHLPFAPFAKIDPASKDKSIRDFTVNYFAEHIKKASEAGIKVMVVHPSGEPYPDNEREERLGYSKECMKKLAEIADSYGAVIAVEDLPRTCIGRNSKELMDIVSADERLRICFDTNHLLSEPIKNFIENIGDKIITTHFSDYDFKNERHWLPGEGSIDWGELVEMLEKADYSGPILYELGLTPPVTGTIKRRNLTFNDFKENHTELVNKRLPKAIGTVNPEKCIHWKDL